MYSLRKQCFLINNAGISRYFGLLLKIKCALEISKWKKVVMQCNDRRNKQFHSLTLPLNPSICRKPNRLEERFTNKPMDAHRFKAHAYVYNFCEH